jgi:large subunit ribosomal protein L7e
LNLLKLVEPYVAWGYPTLETVRELVYKRGFANVNALCEIGILPLEA